MNNFIHLHVHSSYSLLDGFGQVKDYVKVAHDYEMEYIAITDHGNIDNALNFVQEQ